MSSSLAISVLDRLRNVARSRGEDFQFVLSRYGVERLLYRLSESPFADAFILKGAQLLYALTGERHRPTRDLDLLGLHAEDLLALERTFQNLCALEVEPDGLTYDATSVRASSIRELASEGGARVRLTALLGRTRIPVQIDIGFGDVVTPSPVELRFPSLLQMPTPVLRAYPIETVVAEKFEAILSRGTSTSRLKDFYDLWRISDTFDLDRAKVHEAVQRTFERRGTKLPESPSPFQREFWSDATKRQQWPTFLARSRLEAPPLEEVCNTLGSWYAEIVMLQ